MDHDRAASFIAFLDEFHRVRGRITVALSGMFDEGLSDMEVVVFNAVAGASSPPTVPQIGRSLGHARQVIQRAANTLIERGLIETVANPDHKRAHRLVPTERGRIAKQIADRRGLEQADRMTAGLDRELIENGRAALHAIREVLEQNIRRSER